MTTALALHRCARALIAAMATGDKTLEAEAYEEFRRAAYATAEAGHPETAIMVIQHVMRMRSFGGGRLAIPEAAGLTC